MLVNGAGPIGALVVAAATFRGAPTVIAADVAAAPALAGREPWVRDETRDLGGDQLPEDVEVVFEASGAPAHWARCWPPPHAAEPWSRWATCRATRHPPRSATW